jgi:hypothetical protein
MVKRKEILPLDENAVVESVVERLRSKGYEIKQKRMTTQQGIDVIAYHPQNNITALVEAKGGTSSRAGSQRYGKSYDKNQVFDRVSKGVFTCLQLRSENQNKDSVTVILAVPEKPDYFRIYLESVSSSMKAAGIEVWYVSNE